MFWAYLYETPKALWFDKVGGTNSGPVLTGDVLQVVIHCAQPGGPARLSEVSRPERLDRTVGRAAD